MRILNDAVAKAEKKEVFVPFLEEGSERSSRLSGSIELSRVIIRAAQARVGERESGRSRRLPLVDAVRLVLEIRRSARAVQHADEAPGARTERCAGRPRPPRSVRQGPGSFMGKGCASGLSPTNQLIFCDTSGLCVSCGAGCCSAR